MSGVFCGIDLFLLMLYLLVYGVGVGLGKSEDDIVVCFKIFDIMVFFEGSG